MASPFVDSASLLDLDPVCPYNRSIIYSYREGDQALERFPYRISPQMSDQYHTLVEDERLPDVAYKYYNNPKAWGIIADANPDTCFNPFEVPIGTTLLIPDFDRILANYING